LNYDLGESESPNNNELQNYLRDPDTNIEMIDKYPQIKQLFLKYNTTIPTGYHCPCWETIKSSFPNFNFKDKISYVCFVLNVTFI
jgi:hypothetical protein